MTLVAMSALITFVERRHYRYLAVATLLAVIAPLMYEAALGVMLGLCVLLAIWKRAVWALLPAALMLAYMLWRSLGYLVGIDDPYLTAITLDVVSRSIAYLEFKSSWAWTEPVRSRLGLPNNGERPAC